MLPQSTVPATDSQQIIVDGREWIDHPSITQQRMGESPMPLGGGIFNDFSPAAPSVIMNSVPKGRGTPLVGRIYSPFFLIQDVELLVPWSPTIATYYWSRIVKQMRV
jgi:hypothetical protein